MHYLEVIGGSARRMSTLIDDLLVYSRLGRNAMKLQAVDMQSLVQETRAVLDANRQADVDEGMAAHRVEWRIAPLPVAVADENMMRQVWLNLLGNAVKYSARSEPAVIEVACETTPAGHLQFSVRDNGVGFDMEYAGKLFGVFQRLHKASEYPGTGIGLSQRAPGRGPPRRPRLGRVDARGGRDVPLHPAGAGCRIPRREHCMSAIRTILLAEDSTADAEMAIDALREANLTNPIVHVEDGVEAMEYLQRKGRFADRPDEEPAVLLLDIKMPRMDGLEVLRRIRADEKLRRIPVVILSSSREESDLSTAGTRA